MTRNNTEQLPMPKQNDYLNAVFHLASEPREEGVGLRESINSYSMRKQQESFAMVRYAERLCGLGLCLERLDWSTGKAIEEDAPTANAFAYGATAGAIIVESVHKGIVTLDAIVDKMPEYTDYTGDIEDKIKSRYVVAKQIVERGCRGVTLMGQGTERMLQSLEAEVVPNSTDRHMFRVGCGLVALSAFDIHRDLDHKAFEASLHGLHDYDGWDEELARLTPAIKTSTD